MAMLSIKNMSFKGKLLLYAASATGTALTLCCIAVMTAEWIEEQRELPRNLGIQADVIGMNASAALTFDDRASAEESLRGLKADENVILASICSRDGTEFAKYTRAGSEGATEEAVGPDAYRFSGDRLHIRRPIALDGEEIGSIYLQYDLRVFYGRLKALAAILAVVMLIALVGAALVSSRVQRVLTRPVTELASTARAVTENNDYSVRAVKHSADELGALTDTFNDMLSEIEQRDAWLQESRDTLEQQVHERTNTLSQRERQAAAVAKLGQQALAGEDLTALCDRAVELVAETLEVEYVKVLELLPDGEALLLLAGVGWGEGLVGQGTVGAGSDSQAGYTLLAGEPVIVEDLGSEPRFSGPPLLLDHQVISGISVVISGKDRSFGVLGAHTSQRRKFGRDDVHFLQSVANVLATATERAQTEETLRRAKDYIDDIIRSMIDMLVVVAPDGTIRTVNDATCGVLGYTQEELTGQPVTLLFSDDDDDEEEENATQLVVSQEALPFKRSVLRRLVKDGAISNIEKSLRAKGGHTIPALMSGSVIRDNDGAIRGIVCVARDITEQKRAEQALAKANLEFQSVSRQAGMAEVATGVLHNVGNVLNSVNVSSTIVTDRVRRSKVSGLVKATELMREHREDLATFITADKRGKSLPVYLAMLAQHLVQEQSGILEELVSLTENIEHIKRIVTMQQAYAGVSGVVESVLIADLLEDAMKINAGGFGRHGVQVVREYEEVPPIVLEKHKLLQILVNLLSNAKYAMDETRRKDRTLVLRTATAGENHVRVDVIDNGVGIAKENLTRVFSHGFTTKKDGHGFGLHHSGLAAQEMGGTLTAHSDGLGKGATFTLELPLRPTMGNA